MHTPGRGESALRRHRVSLPTTSYFLTLCTAARSEGLTRKDLAPIIRAEISAIENDGHWMQRAGVIMPDHFHLLVQLNGALPIARCVARLKAKTRPALLASNLSWQANFYEHRLRKGDEVEAVLRYIFLNPYQSGIANIDAPYRWFWLSKEDESRFKPETDNGLPFPEWLQ